MSITEEAANRALVKMLSVVGVKDIIHARVDAGAAAETNGTLGWPEIAEIVKEVATEVGETGDWDEVARYLLDGPKESNIVIDEKREELPELCPAC